MLRMDLELYMNRCLQLAENGLSNVAPNPMVGSVIVHDNKIIGSGYHQQYGGPHAEVHAIQSVENKELLQNSTLFVNLEPCSHHGKTPPCADLIIENQIPKVVVAMRDPNPKVAGQGIERLRAAGIEVIEGICEKEAAFLNRRFIMFHTKRRPYIILKWAESADGFMDRLRGESDNPGINWISHSETKKLVHQWRSEERAILVGKNTIENDDPSLTTRLVDGNSPLRVVLSSSGKIPENAKILKDGNPTLIFNVNVSKKEGNAEWIKTDSKLIDFALKTLFERNITSIIVEGGRDTLNRFLEINLWDEIRIIKSPRMLGEGLNAPEFGRIPQSTFDYGKDEIRMYYNL